MSAKRRGIGGTDAGPIIAFYKPELAPELAKYANATDVAMRIAFSIERPRTKVMSRGLDAEPRLRKAYIDAYPCEMVAKPEKWIVQHPRHPWATCSPDDARTDGILIEYKSTSVFSLYPPPNAKVQESRWGDPETDEVPPVYGLQVQWCLEILDLPLAHLFAGFGRDFEENEQPLFLYSETRRYVIERDRELAAMALDYCERFQRDFIEPRKLPPLVPVNNRRAYQQLLKGTHPCLTETAAPSQS
jgi:hypothetical protein